MRTLVVSDLHLGAQTSVDLLRRVITRAPLLEAVETVDRLVLLGDLIEFRHGPVRDALAASEPVLRAVGSALSSGAEVLLVPGNHDYHLLAPWLERRASEGVPSPLGLEAEVDWRPGEPLAAMAGWLAPASVRVAYPGVWLREDVYAMHGHYGDRHTTVPMFERLGAGAMGRIMHEAATGPDRAEDYERVLAPMYEWIHAIAQRGGPELGRSSHGASAQAWQVLVRTSGRRSWRRRALSAAFPAAVAGLN
ncbi:MAG: metallophosphoesterase, partial [Solirubrobacteraceae bacterium]